MSKKILICEDDKSLSKILSTKITNSGFKMVLAENGNDAITKFEQEKPDLVLLDILMPSRSGFEVLEHIRVQLQSKVPVIIISNLNQKADLELARNLGITDYLVKSDISLRDIVIKINRALSA